MKNPLYKRLPREFKSDLGKYLVIFLFIAGTIALVSGFLVADNSMIAAYNEGFEKYNIENGHFELMSEADDELIKTLEKEGVTIYDNMYVDENVKENDSTIRVYIDREEINLVCMMQGEKPENDDEIAIDRMYADNNGLSVGDRITVGEKKLTITGLVALPDYSCLFENNTDMMFDSLTFCVGIMTKEGFEGLSDEHLHYVYAWKYDNEPADDSEEKEVSDDFMKVIAKNAILTGFVPRYANQAIQFTGEDMGGDKAMITLFLYIVIVILAFVFAITTSNTITKEASVIGTLRASGYTRGELMRHYLLLPLIVTLLAAIVGNILGYTVLKEYMAGLYYGSYSLPTYVTLWNAEAFVETTAVPFMLMLVINLIILVSKLKLSPLKFLRHDLSKRTKKKAFKLSSRISFPGRFRLRIIFQNMPNYITLFVGILFAALLMVFGMMFGPMLEDYSGEIRASIFADYQYVLKTQVETDTEGAEKYCVTTLKTVTDKYPTEEITIYGIEEDSGYIDIDFKDGGVYVSNGYMIKYGLKEGDVITMTNPYSDDTYDFTVAGEYEYPAALAVFLTREEFNRIFDKEEDYYTGYLSNEELDDIEDAFISTIITEDDLTKLSRQLTVSIGDFMVIFECFGIIMFLLLVYLLSKQIIEKNAGAISMVKILGYSNGEISGLYIVATTIAVAISLLLSIPVCYYLLEWLFAVYLYTEISGYIPYMISETIFVKLVIYGIVCYAAVAALQMLKISRIPKSDALKNVE